MLHGITPILASLDGKDLSIIGGMFSILWALIQFGDRLWGKKDKGQDPAGEKVDTSAQVFEHELACRLEHQQLITGNAELASGLAKLAEAQATLLTALTTERELNQHRHQELLRTIGLHDCNT